MVVGEGGEPQNASASTDDFIFGQSNFCDLVFYPLYSRKFPFPYIHSYLDKSFVSNRHLCSFESWGKSETNCVTLL